MTVPEPRKRPVPLSVRDEAKWPVAIASQPGTPLIERLRVHPVSGYEWECSECHYHSRWGNADVCNECGTVVTEESNGEYVDSTGRITDHTELVSLAHLKELLAEPAR